jgi:hypothetical protein
MCFGRWNNLLLAVGGFVSLIILDHPGILFADRYNALYPDKNVKNLILFLICFLRQTIPSHCCI